jgi:hypothetical protein
VVPKKRSNCRKNSAIVMTGKARMMSHWTTNDIHVKIGMRMSVMPGARMLMIVAAKLKPAASDDTPRI